MECADSISVNVKHFIYPLPILQFIKIYLKFSFIETLLYGAPTYFQYTLYAFVKILRFFFSASSSWSDTGSSFFLQY